MIQWQFFPKNIDSPELLRQVITCFQRVEGEIDSETHRLPSDDVLGVIRPYLEEIGFRVETGKKAVESIKVPVLFGLNGILEKSFEADAYHNENKTVLEVEAGRGVTNYQFLKDLFQACMMNNVEYLETDSLMYSGSSGCPGFIADGRVFGMQVRSLTRLEDFSSDEEGPLQETRIAISQWAPAHDIISFTRSHGVRL